MEQLKNSQNLEERFANIINKSFISIMSFIYTYDKNGVNIKIFKDYLGLDLENITSSEEFVEEALSRLEIKKEEFLELKKDLEGEEGEKLGAKKDYYLENFEKIALFFDNLANYVEIEAEKIKGLNYKIDEGRKSQILKEIEEREKMIFGAKISEVEDYRNLAIGTIDDLYSKNSGNLTEEEKVFMEELLSEIKQKFDYKETKVEPGNKEAFLKDPLSEENQEVLEKEIDRDDYVRIFNLAFKILGIDKKVVVSETATNMNTTNEEIIIPANKNYLKLKLRKIIELVSHEAEGHMVANTNNIKHIGFLRSVSYVAREEGMAYSFGKLSEGYNLDNIPINKHFYRVFIGENYGGGKFRKFLEIINKLDGETLNVDNYVKRYKRGKDINLAGVNPKDKLYQIGTMEIKRRISNGENPLSFFLAKNGFDEQETINNLVGEGKELSPELLKEKQMVLPLLVGELIRYKLLNTSENFGLLGGFFKHFNDRYGELFKNLGISYKDFVKAYISDLKEEKKEAFNEIMSITEKY